jgi:hypothetical protein
VRVFLEIDAEEPHPDPFPEYDSTELVEVRERGEREHAIAKHAVIVKMRRPDSLAVAAERTPVFLKASIRVHIA